MYQSNSHARTLVESIYSKKGKRVQNIYTLIGK